MNENIRPGEVVDAYFAAVAGNDVAALKALISDDFVQYPPPLGAAQDRDAFVGEWDSRVAENPDSALVYERDHQVVEMIESGPRPVIGCTNGVSIAVVMANWRSS